MTRRPIRRRTVAAAGDALRKGHPGDVERLRLAGAGVDVEYLHRAVAADSEQTRPRTIDDDAVGDFENASQGDRLGVVKAGVEDNAVGTGREVGVQDGGAQRTAPPTSAVVVTVNVAGTSRFSKRVNCGPRGRRGSRNGESCGKTWTAPGWISPGKKA